jgi:hypothetical protein
MARTNKKQETSKKRKVPNDTTETTAKRTKISDNHPSTSGSKEPSAPPAPAPVRSHRVTVMSEEEDAAMPGEDAIHISDGEESEAESSEAELRE